jgi:hypothetical protein
MQSSESAKQLQVTWVCGWRTLGTKVFRLGKTFIMGADMPHQEGDRAQVQPRGEGISTNAHYIGFVISS